MVRAAIEVRKPYVSICDDGDAAAAALALDEAARAKEVPILTGMGWTPGLSNLLARRAAAQLDQVTAVRIAWAGSSGPAPGPAVVLHTMHIFSGRVITYTGGRYRQVRAGSDPERVLFPEPLGALVVCHVGHPEPLTLPQHLPGVQEVSLKGGVVEPVLHHLAAWSGRLGLTGTHRRRERMAHWLRPFIPFFSRIGTGGLDPGAAGLVVRVEGRKDGQPCAIESAAADTIDGLTSVPLALGALWLARNAGQRVGVFPPKPTAAPTPSSSSRTSRSAASASRITWKRKGTTAQRTTARGRGPRAPGPVGGGCPWSPGAPARWRGGPTPTGCGWWPSTRVGRRPCRWPWSSVAWTCPRGALALSAAALAAGR